MSPKFPWWLQKYGINDKWEEVIEISKWLGLQFYPDTTVFVHKGG